MIYFSKLYAMYLQDLVVLVKALSSHGCISELDLSYNVICDEGIKCLAEYLKVTVQKYYLLYQNPWL